MEFPCRRRCIVGLTERGMRGLSTDSLEAQRQRQKVRRLEGRCGRTGGDQQIADALSCRTRGGSRTFANDACCKASIGRWSESGGTPAGPEIPQRRARGAGHRRASAAAAEGLCQRVVAAAGAARGVELEIVESVSHETIRRTQRGGCPAEDRVVGEPAGGRRRVRGAHGAGLGHCARAYDAACPVVCMDERPVQTGLV